MSVLQKDLLAVVKEIENEMQTIMHDSIDDFKDAVAKSAEDNVYAAYTSNAEEPYQRRKSSGGLSDTENYEVEEGRLSLTLYNNTRGNEAYAPPNSDGWNPGFITGIIESGKGYHWKQSDIFKQQPYKRLFMTIAQNNFIDDILLPRFEKHFNMQKTKR